MTEPVLAGAALTGGAPLSVIALTAADLPDIIDLDTSAFGDDLPRDVLDDLIVPTLELDRFIGVRDPAADDELVAQACILSKQLTFPGGAMHPVAGVSWVSVRAGWRRRGLLRAMMTAQLHGLHEEAAEPVAILTASEAALYGRYGYGPAIDRYEFSATHEAVFRPDVRTEPVREIRTDRARAIVPDLYTRIRSTRPGNLGRTDALWTLRFSDHEHFRRGASNRHWAIHPDGFAVYRIKTGWNDRGPNGEVQVNEICAATPVAFASLWRFLLDLDLTREVSYHSGWVDDPLPALLLDRRTVTIAARDHVWLRVVDLDRAIGLRTYSAPAHLVVEVTDALCPWNQGRWAFDLNEKGGAASRTDAAAAVRLDVRDLGACLLGGTPLGRLVTAGLVVGEPDALLELGAALATPVAPWCPEGF